MAETYNICLDIGGTKILGAIFDEKEKIIYRLKKKTKSGGNSSENGAIGGRIDITVKIANCAIWHPQSSQRDIKVKRNLVVGANELDVMHF